MFFISEYGSFTAV